MEVYKCAASGNEFLSSASRPEVVTEGLSKTHVRTEGGEELPVLIRIKSTVRGFPHETSESQDCGVGFNDEEEGGGGDEGEVRKLDYFWQFPDNENEVTDALLVKSEDKEGKKLTPHKTFMKRYFRAYCKSLLHALDSRYPEGNPKHIPKSELEEALGAFSNWVKENRKELSLYTVSPFVDDVEDADGKTRKVVAALAYQIYTGECFFYFFRPGLIAERV